MCSLRKLLDGIQRVGQAVRPEFILELINLDAKFRVGEHGVSLSFLLNIAHALNILKVRVLRP